MIQEYGRLIITFSLLVVAALAGAVGSPAAGQQDPLAANETLAMSWLIARIQGDEQALEPLLAPDIIMHGPMLPQSLQGVEEVKAWMAAASNAFSDLAFDVEHLVTEGDYVGLHCWIDGQFTSDYFGMEATGDSVGWAEIDILRIEAGQIVELWMGYDTMLLAQQLGMVPSEDAVAGEQADLAIDVASEAASSSDPEANKALIRSFKLDLINEQNFDLVPDLVTLDFVFHDHGDTRDVSYRGYDGVGEWLGPLLALVPDTHFLPEELLLVAGEDFVFVHWLAHGTNSGNVPGITATGDEMAVSGNSIYRVADGKVAETWFVMDVLGFMQQLGVIPPQE